MAAEGDLGDLLAKVLPTGAQIIVRHVSSTPAPSAALFAAAPGQTTEATFCENHFLSVSIDAPRDCGEHEGAEIIVFGMEVLVYTTAHLTTIFVSKADSTGLLHLLKLPHKVSVLRLVTNTFLSYLARTHQRPGVRLVISLFARAQNQYLFPGSIENAEKHVLDDRGLIKWWCRSADPILREHEPETVSQDSKQQNQTGEAAKASATAYLIVPGCDRFETRTFFPATAKSDPQDRPRWLSSYPLKQMVHNPSAPPRCLIPRLPDDPKTRFLIDLDDELPEPAEGDGEGAAAQNTGVWRSVRSLDQFWEMMSFRQECSAGRLVGFLWLVINPPGLMNSTTMASRSRSTLSAPTIPATDIPKSSLSDASVQEVPEQPKTDDASPNESVKPVTSQVVPEVPEELPTFFDRPSTSQFTDTNPFYWPEAGRGQVILNDADYKVMMDGVLDHLYNKKEIVTSTKEYVDQVASLADQLTWGKRVVGTHSPDQANAETAATNNILDSGLIRKRKKSGSQSTNIDGSALQPSGSDETAFAAPSQLAPVNVLNAGLVRKKKKT
jgi:regulator of Ty1 transposition protein 109